MTAPAPVLCLPRHIYDLPKTGLPRHIYDLPMVSLPRDLFQVFAASASVASHLAGLTHIKTYS